MELIDYLRYDLVLKMTEAIGEETKRYSDKPLMVLENWANAYGLGILGSQSAFKSRLAIRQKIPVLIDPFRQVYFFPTVSPDSHECVWINASQIKSIRQAGLGCVIRFLDDRELVLAIGRRSLIKQWERCKMMEHLILRHRLNENPIPMNLMR